MQNYIAEFLGTYILCITILAILRYKDTPLAITIGITLSTFVNLLLFSRNDSDFNPAITFMYYLDNKRTITDLLTFSISQYLAAVLAFITFRIIF